MQCKKRTLARCRPLLLYNWTMPTVPVSRQPDVLPESCRCLSAPHGDITNMGRARSSGALSPPEPNIWADISGSLVSCSSGETTKASETFRISGLARESAPWKTKEKGFYLSRPHLHILGEVDGSQRTTAVGSLVLIWTVTSTLLQQPRICVPTWSPRYCNVR